jgi:hypothetical protein
MRKWPITYRPRLPVVHSCFDLSSAEEELPLLCAGELSAVPSSGKGSNATVPAEERKMPKAVFFGGGVSDDEYQSLSARIKEKAPDMVFQRVTKEDVMKAGAKGPNPDVIAKIYREKMANI